MYANKIANHIIHLFNNIHQSMKHAEWSQHFDSLFFVLIHIRGNHQNGDNNQRTFVNLYWSAHNNQSLFPSYSTPRVALREAIRIRPIKMCNPFLRKKIPLPPHQTDQHILHTHATTSDPLPIHVRGHQRSCQKKFGKRGNKKNHAS